MNITSRRSSLISSPWDPINQCPSSNCLVKRLDLDQSKDTRQGFTYTKSLTIQPHTDSDLCPVAAYTTYFQRFASQPARQSYPPRSHLTLNYPFRNRDTVDTPVVSTTIARHIHSIMDLIGKPNSAQSPGPVLLRQPSPPKLVSTLMILSRMAPGPLSPPSQTFTGCPPRPKPTALPVLWINNPEHSLGNLMLCDDPRFLQDINHYMTYCDLSCPHPPSTLDSIDTKFTVRR
ncbi:unnamed protein product [Absidia cylindrospora]